MLRAEIDAPHRPAEEAGPGAVPGQEGHPADRQQAQPEAVAAAVRRSTSARTCSVTRSTASRPARTPCSSSRSAARSGVFLILATQRPGQGVAADRRVSGNVSTRFCLKVAGQVENDMMLGTSALQERGPGHDVPAEDRRRARLPQGRGEHAAGRPDVLPEHRRHRAGRQARPGAARARRDAVRRRARRGRRHAAARRARRRRSRCSAAAAGLHWQALADRLAERFPERWAGASGDAVSAELPRPRRAERHTSKSDGQRAQRLPPPPTSRRAAGQP